MQKKLIRPLALSAVTALVITSCLFSNSVATEAPVLIVQPTAPLSELVVIELTVQADTTVPFSTVGQIINYKYNIRNSGATSTPGPVSATGAICPELNTVGNLDGVLDVNETIVCISSYTITQADLDKGSVTNVVTATVNGINSNQATTTVPTVQPVVLKLTKSANPIVYDHVGQTITYTYVITNSGSAAIGPVQFTVSDTGLAAPINCGDPAATLASNATTTCSATYTITQANLDSGTVATNATASSGGVSSQPISATITKGTATQANSSNLTAGSTIKHQVVAGEWLWQIARCYGADPKKVSDANPPTPGQITPNTTVTVPNIGSAGKIYGPPCVGTHTVQSGDTWSSIATKYNADPTILQMVNPKTLAVGSVLIVPLNSAGAAITTATIPSNCVDLTRNVKLPGAATANVTHFNICGLSDASGNMKINTIAIKQRPEDVPTGAFSQDITTVPSSITTSTPINNATSLIVGDVNYDGNDDFRIVEFLPAGPNIPYLYFIYDPATNKFVYNEAYRKITSPEFPGNSEIRSKWRDNAVKWGIDTYAIANNTPKLTRRETWEAINETQAKHQVIVFNADGTSQVTVDETIPIPAQ